MIPSAAPLLLAWAVLAAPGAPELPPEGEPWFRLRTESFTLYSNAREGETAGLARELETLRTVLRKLVSGAVRGSSKPVSVYVFRTTERFRAYTGDVAGGSKQIVGFHVASPDRHMFAVDVGAPESPRATIFHEYTHEVFGTMFRNLPLWASEGFAELYSTFRVLGRKAEIGRPDPDLVALARGQEMIPLPVLLSADVSSPLYSGEGKHGMFYAESWALVHMLMIGNADRRTQLPRYLTLLEEGEKPEAAFRTAFGTDYEGLARELAAYVRRAAMSWLVYDTGELPPIWIGEPEPLERSETLTHLGILLARTEDDPGPAEAHFRAALAIDPPHPLAEAGLATQLVKSKRYDEAAALYDRALERDPRDPSTNRLAAFALLERFIASDHAGRDPGVMPPEIARARAMLGVVLEFEPDDADVLGAYGSTWVYDPGDPAAGIRALEKAAALDPRDGAALFSLVQLYGKAGEADKARAVIDGPLARVARGDDLAQARESLLQIDIRAADAAGQAGDVERAIAILESVRDRSIDPGLKARIEERLPELRAFAARKAEVGRFNEAVTLLNAGKYAAARAILEALSRDATDDEVRRRSKEVLSEIPPPRKKG